MLVGDPAKQIAREAARRLVKEAGGTSLEIFIDAPLAVCEGRDTKGLYKKARGGLLPHFTGIDDPYEVPAHPDLAIDTVALPAEEAAGRIVKLLAERGVV